MQRNGWRLLFYEAIIEQLERLGNASIRAQRSNPDDYQSNANYKLFESLSYLLLTAIPESPGSEKYRQGKTLGAPGRHWRRAKLGRRFRVFFRYDSRSKVIIYAWVNDKNSLRAAGGKNDPYAVFKKMLERGSPPTNWYDLFRECIKNNRKARKILPEKP